MIRVPLMTPVQTTLDTEPVRVVFDGISPVGGVYLSNGQVVNSRAQIQEKKRLATDLLRAASRFSSEGKMDKAARLAELGKDYSVQTSVSSIRYEREKWNDEELANLVSAGGTVYLFNHFPEKQRRIILDNMTGLKFSFRKQISKDKVESLMSLFQIKMLSLGETTHLSYEFSNWSDGTSTLVVQHDNQVLLVTLAESFHAREWSLWPKDVQS